jgi:hypothetical protein
MFGVQQLMIAHFNKILYTLLTGSHVLGCDHVAGASAFLTLLLLVHITLSSDTLCVSLSDVYCFRAWNETLIQ